MIWTGRILSGLMVLFLLFDAGLKIAKAPAAVQGTVQLGYPAGVIVWLGITLLVSTILYVIPQTAVLGAILLTGYLGGATATQVRVENAWYLFPPFLGVLIWGGLFLREDRLRELLPLRKT